MGNGEWEATASVLIEHGADLTKALPNIIDHKNATDYADLVNQMIRKSSQEARNAALITAIMRSDSIVIIAMVYRCYQLNMLLIKQQVTSNTIRRFFLFGYVSQNCAFVTPATLGNGAHGLVYIKLVQTTRLPRLWHWPAS